MALTILPPIAGAAINRPELRYVWDDTRASLDFGPPPATILARLEPLTPRAKIALAIGMYEWVVYRFLGMVAETLPFDLAEGAWCANVDRRYMEYLELTRRDWLGPVRGPIWCAATWLLPAIYFSDEEPEELRSGLSYLSQLAFHVSPQPELFEAWLNATVERLRMFYVSSQPDPYGDLFGERDEERRGPLVAREVLDPGFGYRPELAETLVARFLASVDYRSNSLLRSPTEMSAVGFDGIPYSVQPQG